MPRVELDDIAAASYDRVLDPGLLEKIHDVFDALEDDPGQAWLRTHRWIDPPLWGVSIRAPRDTWLVLWHLDEDDPDLVIVDYIGTDTQTGR